MRKTARLPLAVVFVSLAGIATFAAGDGPRSMAVEYANGDVPLAAELLVPASEGPVPGAVIVQGSGTSDRGNAWARAIALELVEQGLAVLLTDKRGSGLSGGDWRRASFGELASDALMGARLLAERPEVDARRVGLVGLSQGGRVAPIAAAVDPDEIAFVVNLSGSAVSFAEQSFFEMAATTRQAGFGEEGVERVIEINRLAARSLIDPAVWKAYLDARQAAIDGGLEGVAAGFPSDRDATIWTFLRQTWDFDPMPYWTLVRQPALVVYGSRDEGDNVPVDESVRRLEFGFRASGHDAARIVVIEGAGHALLDPEGGGLHRRLKEELASWLDERVRAAGADG